MHFFDRIPSASLERREMQLILTASPALIILAGGLVLFMYPVVFSPTAPPNWALASAYCGFCVPSALLAGYLFDLQVTIQSLRHQIAEGRMHSSRALKQASANLLQTFSNFDSFQDRLPMEYRRAVSEKYELRFTFRISAFSYPEQASSTRDLERAVFGLLPEFSLASQRSIGKPVPLAAEQGHL